MPYAKFILEDNATMNTAEYVYKEIRKRNPLLHMYLFLHPKIGIAINFQIISASGEDLDKIIQTGGYIRELEMLYHLQNA